MTYILNDKVKVNKPIVFLCGPYYRNCKSDRRKILQEFFLKKFPSACLPLIIDDFLIRDNIGDAEISVQLLEEIFAGIAQKTYIFLDTMSAAVELGLFTNNAYKNSLYVLIPCEKDKNCNTIGDFIKGVVLEDNADRVKTFKYHPRIERVAFSTDYVGEHYKFINDKLPTRLEKDILQDYEQSIGNDCNIVLECVDSYPKEAYYINYKYDKTENGLVVFASVKLLFYIVGAIIYSEYDKILRNKEKLEIYDINRDDIDNVVSHLKSVIITFFIKKGFWGIDGKTKISIQTILENSIEGIVKHIMAFVFTYHKSSRLRGYFIIEKNEVIREQNLGRNPTDFFDLNSKDIEIIGQFNCKNAKCFRSFDLKSGYKKRPIVTYTDDSNGLDMRNLHEKMAGRLINKYQFSQYSFAYQKGKSVKLCVECHEQSISFLKFDIHKFFNSIDKKRMARKLMREYELDRIYAEHVSKILDTCFFRDEMPIGLITSPVLSDIYMKEFDVEFMEELGSRYTYTRYADDILVSCFETIDQEEELRIRTVLKKQLSAIGLLMNEKKYVRKDLRKKGDSIKYLGINIVKTEQKNVITVGKSYKNHIAKNYLKYILMEDGTKEKYYFGKQIAGYISFVKMIEGEEGLQKIYKRIEKSTEGRVKIKDRINNL